MRKEGTFIKLLVVIGLENSLAVQKLPEKKWWEKRIIPFSCLNNWLDTDEEDQIWDGKQCHKCGHLDFIYR